MVIEGKWQPPLGVENSGNNREKEKKKRRGEKERRTNETARMNHSFRVGMGMHRHSKRR